MKLIWISYHYNGSHIYLRIHILQGSYCQVAAILHYHVCQNGQVVTGVGKKTAKKKLGELFGSAGHRSSWASTGGGERETLCLSSLFFHISKDNTCILSNFS